MPIHAWASKPDPTFLMILVDINDQNLRFLVRNGRLLHLHGTLEKMHIDLDLVRQQRRNFMIGLKDALPEGFRNAQICSPSALWCQNLLQLDTPAGLR